MVFHLIIDRKNTYFEEFWDFSEHIFKKMGSTEIVVSSVRPSVSYFSAAIAPRELKLSMSLLLYSGQ
jgi:hypothetical protein